MLDIILRSLLFLASLLVTITHSTPPESTNIYGKIQPLNLASLNWEDEDWPNESFYDYLNRCFIYQARLQEFKKRRIVFKLFDSLTQDTQSHNCLYDMGTLQDLNLLAGKKMADPYIGSIIDRTHTQLGKVFLYGLISNPIDDIAQLTRRQELIKLFLHDEKLFTHLVDIYHNFSAHENLLLSVWDRDGFLQTTKRRYFAIPLLHHINDRCNRSVLLLQTKSIFDHAERALFVLSGLAAATILPIFGFSKLAEQQLPDPLNRLAERFQGSGHVLFPLIAGMSNHRFFTAWISLFAGVFCAFGLKEIAEWARDNVVLDTLVQEKMISITRFLRAIVRLSNLISYHPELVRVCPAAAKIAAFELTEFHTPQMRQLFALCKSPTFAASSSIFSMHGRVVVAFKLMYDLKEKFEPLLMALGELDAYLSCAQLYKEFEHKPVHFCFATYITDQTPSITMTDFWNPFINPDTVVSNAIQLQGATQKNMIITGPNAGGKSTLIKAIPINLILAQSIGLAAATSVAITPFHSIATYLNIVDDIAAGNSLFKAQVLRAQEMITLVEQTPSTKFSFVALDEMFNGTSAKESMATAYSVVKHIGNFDNNISIIATHFPLLTTLGTTHDAFENYKVSVIIDPDGSIHYPFKLERGISNQHIALDILKQEGYGYGIIKEATEILKTINL